MRQIFLFLTVILVALSASAQKQYYSQDSIYISGTIDTPKEGLILRIFRIEDGRGDQIAQDTLRGKEFSFSFAAENDETGNYSLVWFDGPKYSPDAKIWALPGKPVKITATDMEVHRWQVESADPRQATENFIADATRPLHIEFTACFENLRASKDRRFKEKADSINVLISQKEIECLKSLPVVDDVWILYLEKNAQFANAYEAKELIPLYENRLNEEHKQSYAGQKIHDYLYRIQLISGENKIGDLFDLNGNRHRLEDFLGKPILLDFWSLHCGPCHLAIPEMKEIYEKYGERLTIVSINLDSETNWRVGLKKHKISWHNLNDPRGDKGLMTQFTDDRAIPHFVILSPEGKLLRSWKGFRRGLLHEEIGKIME